MSKQLKIFKGRETCFNGYSKITMSELQKMSEERQQTIQKKKILQKKETPGKIKMRLMP